MFTPKLVRQHEPHICGLCVARMLYKTAGVPGKALRRRLHVDRESPELGGTEPSDLLRVLKEDGFNASAHSTFPFPGAAALLGRGGCAFALVAINGGLHWVLAYRCNHGFVYYADPVFGYCRARAQAFAQAVRVAVVVAPEAPPEVLPPVGGAATFMFYVNALRRAFSC